MLTRVLAVILAILFLPEKGFAQKASPTEVAALWGLGIGFLTYILLYYICFSLCLYIISKKTKQTDCWMAWVPLANLILICKIGGMPYSLILGFLSGFVPIVGFFSVPGLLGYMWFKIALARAKPGWLGVGTVVPLLGLVCMAIIASANDPEKRMNSESD